jgi:hypothetical protein
MRILIAMTCLAVAACSPQPAAKQGTVRELDGAFEFTTLEIINDAGEQLVFDVYLAQDFEQQRRGLMFVRSMPERTGMLFIYETDDIRSMWMKNTYIPLDMVFARSDGTGLEGLHRTSALRSRTQRRCCATPGHWRPQPHCPGSLIDF